MSRQYINHGVCTIQLSSDERHCAQLEKTKEDFDNIEPPKQDMPYSTDNIKKMLEVAHSLHDKSIIHFLAASGVRICALPKLRLNT